MSFMSYRGGFSVIFIHSKKYNDKKLTSPKFNDIKF